MKPLLITSYVNPDLDGVACMIAYQELLRDTGEPVEITIFGEPQDEARWALGYFRIEAPPRLENARAYDRVVLVDASDPVDLEGKVPPKHVSEIIDHRKNNDAGKFANAKVQIEFVGAAATLIAERFFEKNILPSEKSAALLAAAIISGTSNFLGIATDRDKSAFSRLNEIAKLPVGFAQEMFLAKSDLSGAKLVETIAADWKHSVMHGKGVGAGQIEMIGTEELIAQRTPEILEAMRTEQKELGEDFGFLNLIDLENGTTFLFAEEPPSKALLESALGITFEGPIAKIGKVLMRKQITPLVKQVIENMQH